MIKLQILWYNQNKQISITDGQTSMKKISFLIDFKNIA